MARKADKIALKRHLAKALYTVYMNDSFAVRIFYESVQLFSIDLKAVLVVIKNSFVTVRQNCRNVLKARLKPALYIFCRYIVSALLHPVRYAFKAFIHRGHPNIIQPYKIPVFTR